MRSKPFVIAGQRIRAGETRDIYFRFSETYMGRPVSIPVRVIRARRSGPRVFLTGAIHGEELAGVGIIRQLLFDQPPRLTRGTLVCVPVVNYYGLEHHSRYLPDRRDLNRCFPGSASGSLASRLANALYEEVIAQCNYGIDFHTAAVRRANYPNIRADLRNPQVRQLAQVFGCELIVNGKGPENSLRRTAVADGIPTIILEAGEVWKIIPGVVDIGVRGCMNVLRHLDMVKGEPEQPAFQVNIDKTTWVRAEQGGFLGFNVRPGELVEVGRCLAINYNIFGAERNYLISPVYGIVLGMTTMPAVKPGDPVYHIAVLNERTFYRIRRRIETSRPAEFYRQLREDLSAGVVIQEGPDQ